MVGVLSTTFGLGDKDITNQYKGTTWNYVFTCTPGPGSVKVDVLLGQSNSDDPISLTIKSPGVPGQVRIDANVLSSRAQGVLTWTDGGKDGLSLVTYEGWLQQDNICTLDLSSNETIVAAWTN